MPSHVVTYATGPRSGKRHGVRPGIATFRTLERLQESDQLISTVYEVRGDEAFLVNIEGIEENRILGWPGAVEETSYAG